MVADIKCITDSRAARKLKARQLVAAAVLMGPGWCAHDKITGRCIRPDHDADACADKRGDHRRRG